MNLSQPYKYYVQPSKVGGGQLNFAIFLGAMDVHVGADIRRAPPPVLEMPIAGSLSQLLGTPTYGWSLVKYSLIVIIKPAGADAF